VSTTGNTLDDFPAEAFSIRVFCDACGQNIPLDRGKVPEGFSTLKKTNPPVLRKIDPYAA
jgi:hypothetical protein